MVSCFSIKGNMQPSHPVLSSFTTLQCLIYAQGLTKTQGLYFITKRLISKAIILLNVFCSQQNSLMFRHNEEPN